MIFSILIEEVGRDNRFDDLFHDVGADLFDIGLIRLRRNNDSLHAERTSVAVLDRDLRFAVRAKIRYRAVTTHLRKLSGQIMCHLDRHGHQLRRLITGVTKHQALIAGTTGVNTLRDVGRLRADSVHNAARVGVVPERSIVIADLVDGIADDLLIVDGGRGSDLSGYDG